MFMIIFNVIFILAIYRFQEVGIMILLSSVPGPHIKEILEM